MEMQALQVTIHSPNLSKDLELFVSCSAHVSLGVIRISAPFDSLCQCDEIKELL